MTTALAIELAERGLVPLGGLRLGVRQLLKQRLRDIGANEACGAGHQIAVHV